MPTDVRQFYYNCKGCGELLRPLQGDCRVFCSMEICPAHQISTASAVSEDRLRKYHHGSDKFQMVASTVCRNRMEPQIDLLSAISSWRPSLQNLVSAR